MTRGRRLRRRDRRALLVGLAVLAPAAAYRAGVAPWLEYRLGLGDALAAERDLLARERAAIRDAARLSAYRAELESALDGARPRLLAGASAMAASGELSRYVTVLGRNSAILIQEVQSRGSEDQARLLESTTVTVRALGDLEGVTRFLHALENGPRLLQVTEFTLRTAGVNDGDLERGQLMSLGLVVTGFWLGEPEDPITLAVTGGAP